MQNNMALNQISIYDIFIFRLTGRSYSIKVITFVPGNAAECILMSKTGSATRITRSEESIDSCNYNT